MTNYHGRFVWYELMTTDLAAARAFYSKVVGWTAQDASTAAMAYVALSSGTAPVAGLMDLPQEARRMGATPRWMGYVSVDNAEVAAGRLRGLGGAIYVPPTDSNIGRIAVVADSQTATLAVIEGLRAGQHKPPEANKPGRVGWHELLTADSSAAFTFYSEIFGWQKPAGETDPKLSYQLFCAGDDMIGGMFNKRPIDPVPFWLFYFNVGDIDAAAERVEVAGGEVFEGPLELPGGSFVARCRDPQGAAFALQGKRSQEGIARASASELSWSTAWGGISSRGRMVVTKPRGRKPGSDSEG